MGRRGMHTKRWEKGHPPEMLDTRSYLTVNDPVWLTGRRGLRKLKPASRFQNQRIRSKTCDQSATLSPK